MKHSELCKIAVDWLQRPASRKGPGCLVAVSETANAINGEIPDAIGWRPYSQHGCGSTLVEVKTSRADFFADAAKPHRSKRETGMGAYRYYMTPANLVAAHELPEQWGLLEVNDRGHIKVLTGHVIAPKPKRSSANDPWRHAAFNMTAEGSLLAMVLNRIGDPQKIQDMIREANNNLARSLSANERLRIKNADLRAEILQLKQDALARA